MVFFDHTKQRGKVITEETDGQTATQGTAAAPAQEDWDDDANGGATDTPAQEGDRQPALDDSHFNSFTFHKKKIFSSQGELIDSPNVELFYEYYKKAYMDTVSQSSNKDMQGGVAVDIRRMIDAMREFPERRKEERFREAKPFLFILPNVSRYMTRPGEPDDKEHAILMLLFNATQLSATGCKMMLFVDKMNDLPAWFESENSNSAVKKIFVAPPDGQFRETFFHLEMRSVMEPITDAEIVDKVKKFSAYTEKFSLRRLQQLKTFIEVEEERLPEGEPSLRRIDDIDKTVLKFEVGRSENPWRDKGLRKTVGELETSLMEEIKGQSKAIKRVSEAMKSAVTGVNSSKKNDRRPRAILFFAGPTGTGKTELTKQLADKIFKNQDSIIRFDMSEFREEHTDARLFGAPPGYVGYEAGGELTRAVKNNPFSIILFDEIEKAAPRIWDKFLQILGDGRLTDGKGETVSFTQSIIIFTSNLGITADSDLPQRAREREVEVLNAEIAKKIEEIDSEADEAKQVALIKELKTLELSKAPLAGLTSDLLGEALFVKYYKKLGYITQTDAFNAFVGECVKKRIMEYFERIGRREVLGRIGEDNILVFNFISPKVATQIADKTVDKYCKAMKEDNDSHLNLTVSEEAREFIKKEVQAPEVLNFGGRGIVNAVEETLGVLVGKFLFDNEGTGLHAQIDCVNGKLTISLTA